MPKTVKGGPFGNFSMSILLQNIKKLEGGPFGDIKKIYEKSLTKPKLHAQKKLVKSETQTHVLLLGRRQKLS